MKISIINNNFVIIASLFLSFLTAESQTKIQLVDKTTKEPIAFAHIYFQNSGSGVVSNSEGMFGIGEDTANQKESIVIQHVAYNTQQIPLSKLFGLPTIEMVRKTIMLSEIAITDKTAKSIISNSVDSMKINHLIATMFKTYYREYVIRNKEYVKYADGVINYHTTLNKKKDRLNISPEIVQSRAYDLAEEGDFDIDLISPIDIKKLISYNVIDDIGKFLKKENRGDYVFEINFSTSTNPDYYEIIVTPKEGVEKVLYTGRLLIEKSDMSIREIQFESDSTLHDYFKEVKLFGLSMKVTRGKGFLQFSKNEHGSYLKYGKISFSIHTETKKKINQDNEFISEVVINDFTSEDDNRKYSVYKKRSLYKNGQQYDYDFWESGGAIISTSEEEKLIQKLIEKSKSIKSE